VNVRRKEAGNRGEVMIPRIQWFWGFYSEGLTFLVGCWRLGCAP
jgi:hypothetical protein